MMKPDEKTVDNKLSLRAEVGMCDRHRFGTPQLVKAHQVQNDCERLEAGHN